MAVHAGGEVSPARRRSSLVVFAALLVALLALPSLARASAAVTLEVEPQRAQVGEIVRVRYTVRIRNESDVRVGALNFGTLQVLSDPSPPELPMMMWGGGMGVAMTMDTANEYMVRALAPGRYTISGASVTNASGRVIAQQPPVTIEVGGGAGAGAGTPVVPGTGAPDDAGMAFTPAGPPPDPDAPPTGDLTGAEYNPTAFVRVAVDNPNPYLGEQIVLRAWLYVASTEAGCDVAREPSLTGFWNESLVPASRECAARWFTQNVGQRFMNVGLIKKIALFPSQTGALTIGPMNVNVELVTGGFFRSIQRAVATSPEVTVQVREPPAAGRPAGYVPGTVGHPVTLAAEIDRTDIAVGETATITVRATSEGSLASASIAPPAHIDGVRVRAGETRAVHDTSSGRVVTTLTTELLVVPERPGAFDLGAAELPYWDPTTERYETARVALPTLRATGAALPREPGEADGTGGAGPGAALRPLTRDPSLRAYAPWFARGRGTLALLALMPLLVALGVGSRAGARRLVARAKERKAAERDDPDALLEAAKRALAAGDGAGAVATAGRALDRAQTRARAELGEGVLARLAPAARATVDEARAACDAARFAGAAGEGASGGLEPREVIARVERAVRALDELEPDEEAAS